MTELLVVPLKKPSEVDVVQPLNNLIRSAYNISATNELAADYAEAISEFSQLRNAAIIEKYESSLETIYRQVCFEL